MPFGNNLRQDLVDLEIAAVHNNPFFHQVRINVITPGNDQFNNTSLTYSYFPIDGIPTLRVLLHGGQILNNIYYFPYCQRAVDFGPGFSIVPINQDCILTTGTLSGCGISIYDINNYRIYVHNEHNGNGFIQLADPNHQNFFINNIISELDNMIGITGNDKNQIVDYLLDNINRPTYIVNGTLSGIMAHDGRRKSDYDYINFIQSTQQLYPSSGETRRRYSCVIHQNNGNINLFFFPLRHEICRLSFAQKCFFSTQDKNILIHFNRGNPHPIYYY